MSTHQCFAWRILVLDSYIPAIEPMNQVPGTMNILFAAALFSYLSARIIVQSDISFTNLKCTSLDTSFLDLEYCFLKSVNRSYKYMSIKANLFQVPVRKVSVTVVLLKRASGFKPFLYNITVDLCKFFKSRNANKLYEFFYSPFENYSNFNHTCPYEHDLLVEKLPISILSYMFGKLLPFPEGEYQIHGTVHAYNIPRLHAFIQFVKN